MTRQEFIDNVNTWDELISFCYDESLDTCESVYSHESMEEHIECELGNYVREHSWIEVRDTLDSIDTGYDYYFEDGWLCFVPLDDVDFDSYKSDVLSEMDGYWDEDPEETEEEETEDQEPLPEEDISIRDLFNLCSGLLNSINNEETIKETQETECFKSFVSGIIK